MICKNGKKKLFLLGIMLMTVLSAAPVMAAEKKAEAKIPVSCISENITDPFEYKLSFLTGDTKYQEPNRDTLSLKNGETDFFDISFVYPGTYSYKVEQTKGSDSQTTYDETVYTIDVYVTENEKGELYAEPIAYIEGKTEKQDGCNFHNVKKVINTPDTPNKNDITENVKTGDDSKINVFLITAFGSLLIICLVLLGQRKQEEDN